MKKTYTITIMLFSLMCATLSIAAQQEPRPEAGNTPHGLKDTIIEYGFVQVAPMGSKEFKSKGPDFIKIDYDFNEGHAVLIRFVDTTFYFEKRKDTIDEYGNKYTDGLTLYNDYIGIHRTNNLAIVHIEAFQTSLRLFTTKFIKQMENEDSTKSSTIQGEK